MKLIINNRVSVDMSIFIRREEDLNNRVNLDYLINKIIELELKTDEPYQLVRMQQRILEHYGIYPKSYDPRDRSNLVLNLYTIDDLRLMRRRIE